MRWTRSSASRAMTRAKKYDVQVGGVSLITVIPYVRELFGLADSRISGEITVEHAAAGAGKDADAEKFAMRPASPRGFSLWGAGIVLDTSHGLSILVRPCQLT
jgi:hypothetical protein